ncbi:3-deoxy-D-manno-octulosonic-acid transferase [Pedobacter westerhofensis]|uniref:3-deoxy-D-manno-octulosonic acid transferase n=1 Tax=Pedobacter westerhofensis TaxID=425512 RepID=A0A521F1Z6_9SPHI|nr:glycosyltransferase N-terminal domain-containing protein [Pedobacter westerhofensis]SMO90218.1 3-deoxy-D-manno-octulosonic-acid transferase [Pedobacter westerhofensis]
MLWLYNFGIFLYTIVLHIASIFNNKAKLFLNGRKNIFTIIKNKVDITKKHVWFHFASLGEFEQGRPVLEELKHKYPDKLIVITFFSPSGFEIRKNYPLAEGVFYLPLDTKKNAAEFVRLINPEIAIFTKYEFWHHYFSALHQQGVPLFIISGIFRPEQAFFKWYGDFYRGILRNVSYFFVQNQQSVNLLKALDLNNVSLSGDTRFDRVAENAKHPKELPLISKFCGAAPVFIAGSTWLPDEQLLKEVILKFPEWKFIIAPHETHTAHISEILKLLPAAARYTQLGESAAASADQVLIIDNIGILSSVYQYGKIAYIGGGFGTGIHNTLEAAAFGLPVIFGPKYDKFQEAKDLLALQAAITVQSAEELSAAFIRLQKDHAAGAAAKKYVEDKTGSTAQIIKHLGQYI